MKKIFALLILLLSVLTVFAANEYVITVCDTNAALFDLNNGYSHSDEFFWSGSTEYNPAVDANKAANMDNLIWDEIMADHLTYGTVGWKLYHIKG